MAVLDRVSAQWWDGQARSNCAECLWNRGESKLDTKEHRVIDGTTCSQLLPPTVAMCPRSLGSLTPLAGFGRLTCCAHWNVSTSGVPFRAWWASALLRLCRPSGGHSAPESGRSFCLAQRERTQAALLSQGRRGQASCSQALRVTEQEGSVRRSRSRLMHDSVAHPWQNQAPVTSVGPSPGFPVVRGRLTRPIAALRCSQLEGMRPEPWRAGPMTGSSARLSIGLALDPQHRVGLIHSLKMSLEQKCGPQSGRPAGLKDSGDPSFCSKIIFFPELIILRPTLAMHFAALAVGHILLLLHSPGPSE